MSNKLSEVQQRVYDVLDKHEGQDVPIVRLYAAARPDDFEPRTSREMQQYLGGVFYRINSKVLGRIKPGKAKRTYRLYKNG